MDKNRANNAYVKQIFMFSKIPPSLHRKLKLCSSTMPISILHVQHYARELTKYKNAYLQPGLRAFFRSSFHSPLVAAKVILPLFLIFSSMKQSQYSPEFLVPSSNSLIPS
jgi:hypothetical protein